ncbi:MAG: YhcH/YjgK/YiaL family protein [Clostridia bacterium]
MIIADFNSLAPYKAVSKNMQLAIEYLEQIDLQSMEDDKYHVIDDDIFVVVSTYPTRDHNESKYEAHRNYIDIQCLISGEELIFCNQACRMEADGSYNAVNDKLNFKDQEGEVSIHLKPGMAVIFYPNDAHKACCKFDDKPKQVRKLLVKVKLEE